MIKPSYRMLFPGTKTHYLSSVTWSTWKCGNGTLTITVIVAGTYPPIDIDLGKGEPDMTLQRESS